MKAPVAAATWLVSAAVLMAGCGLNRDTDDDANTDVGSSTTLAATTTTVVPRQFYTVVRGDTLVGIANKFDIDLNALVSENGIADPTRIFVGQQLLIPPPPDETEGPQLTIAPATNPRLPPIEPTITTFDTEG